MSTESWTPQFVLPNLSVVEPIGTDDMAIVAATDARVLAFAETRPDFTTFVNRFTDAFHAHANVAILLRRNGAPATYNTAEAAAAFRNIVALAIVTYARGILPLTPNYRGIFWGDTFAFHPWMLSRDPDTLFCYSPAMLGIHDVTAFHGQSSPAVPLLEARQASIDQPLLDLLLHRWTLAYGKETMEHEDIKLFRSLNVAYNASLIPAPSRETQVFDVGRLLSLWVSAFEILAHPGPGRAVTRDRVLDVLDQQPAWYWTRVRDLDIPIKALRAKKDDPPMARKLPSWFYVRLYNARNDFLHGNQVTATSHLVESDGTKSLLDVAAPLYRLGLASTLELEAPPMLADSERHTPQYSDAVIRRSRFRIYQKTYEDALLYSLSANTYKTFFGIDRPIVGAP